LPFFDSKPLLLRHKFLHLKVTEHIKQSKKTLISFEILPPLKGKDMNSIYKVLDPLMEFKPPFINVTYHRYDYVFKEIGPDLFQKVYTTKRPGTVGICAAIQFKYGVDAVPHIICGGFTKDQTEDALIDLAYLGVNNVLALRGDPAKDEKSFKAEKNGHPYALDLVRQVQNMNEGKYLANELQNSFKTNFEIGIAGYPEKHNEAPNLDTDLKHLKAKVNAGAKYIVTQMFFDNQKYFQFVDNCKNNGINVPVIPGIKPITRKNQIKSIPRTFNVDIPIDLIKEIEKCKDDEAVRQVGAEWCVTQTKELIKKNAPCVHFYTMGKVGNMIEIVKKAL